MNRLKTVLVVAAGVLIAIAATGFQRGWLSRGQASSTLMLSGNIETHESILSFQSVQSRIVELPFDEGQWIRKGTIVARVEDADYRQQVAMARAAVGVQERQLAAAGQSVEAARKTLLADQADVSYKETNYARIRDLAARGFAAADARDLAEAALKQSRAALERDRALEQVAERNTELARAAVHSASESLKLAEIEAEYTTLRAPFDGVILVRHAELGEVTVPGTPVITLADIDHVWLRAYVNEPDVGRVRLGQDAVVTADNYPGRHYHGRVSFIAEKAEFTPKSVETHAERVTLVYRVRIDVDNPQHELVPGIPADAQLQLGAARP
jgi:HlyD family secretion protein